MCGNTYQEASLRDEFFELLHDYTRHLDRVKTERMMTCRSSISTYYLKNVEDIVSLLSEVQEAVMYYSRFTSMVAFSSFKSGVNTLDNINGITEGCKTNHSRSDRPSITDTNDRANGWCCV